MAEFLTLTSEWMIRAVVLLSLGAHVVLTLLASIRRREGSGVWTVILWTAYQVADWATPFVLSNLSLGSTSREQQLVALWLPFLLIHLGGPDNITAYSFDDNKISFRQVISSSLRFLGITIAIYKQVKIVSSKGALFWASAVMVAVGVAKYVERVRALREADFGNIRSASKNQQKSFRMKAHGYGAELSNEQALLTAHELFHITKGAFADFSVDEDQLKHNTLLKEIFHIGYKNIGWENMCKVVEMELSLMYDILYTKTAKIHTSWFGYFIRIISPVATATMAFLFFFYNKDGQRRADVCITYILLVVTFVLEVRWLLRVIASTWTYTFFNAQQKCWLQHEVFCTGRWHMLRRVILSLDPRQLLFRQSRGSYRLWSGAMGQYNLFDERVYDTTNLLTKLIKKVVSEDSWMEYKCSKGLKLHISKKVEKLLFDHIREAFKVAYRAPEEEAEEKKKEAEEKKKKKGAQEEEKDTKPDAGFKRRRRLDEALGFVPESQELILIWHVATHIFLSYSHQQLSEMEEEYVDAIKAVSNYMTYLATVLPDMLPGLKLRSLHDVIRRTLNKICQGSKRDKLASILQRMEKRPEFHKHGNDLYRLSVILSDGTKFSKVLQTMLTCTDWDEILNMVQIKRHSDSEKRILILIHQDFDKLPVLNMEINMEILLKLILRSWVRMLIFVSYRCGRDSHAKQLGRGCELTTIVWILGEHAGIFGI